MALTKITPQMFDTSAAGHDFNIDNGTFVVDASANRVGIGTTTPSTLLDVNGALTATTIAGTLTTAAQTNITSLGTLTALTVDDITIDGSTISDAGGFLIDVGGDIALDADGGDINFKDGGTLFGQISNASGLYLVSNISDADIFIRGNDGGSMVNALTFDMSEGGNATFSGSVTADERVIVTGNTNNYSTAPLIYFDSTSTANAGVRDWAIGPADDSYGNFHIFVGASTGADPVGNAGRVVTITNSGNVGIGGSPVNSRLYVKGSAFGGQLLVEGGIGSTYVGIGHGTDNPALHWQTGDFRFATSTASDLTGFSEKMRIRNDGNVGIGSNGMPSFSGTAQLSIGPMAHLMAENTSGTSRSLHISQNAHLDADGSWETMETDEASNYYQHAGTHGFRVASSTSAGTDITWTTGLLINNDGNVGIGAAPNTTGFGGTFKYLGVNAGSGYGVFNGQTSSTTQNDAAVSFFGSTTGSSGYKLLGGMQVVNAASSSSNAEGDMRFYTATGGSIYERMRIDNSGHVTMPKQPYVQGRGNGGWSAFSGSAIWEIQPHGSTPVTSLDRNSDYSTTNKRFTCPVDGVYLVMASWYIYQTAAASAGSQYIHPAVYKNGNIAWNSNMQPYTIVGFEINRSGTGSKHYDGVQIAFTVYCSANDYIDIRAYTPNSNTQSYENYHYFSYTLLS